MQGHAMKVISHNKILQSIYMIDCTLKPDLRCNFRQQYQSIINEIMTLFSKLQACQQL